jgi:hypothetical protein
VRPVVRGINRAGTPKGFNRKATKYHLKKMININDRCALIMSLLRKLKKLVVRKVSEVGGDTDPESIVDVFAILKSCRTFEPEYAEYTIDGVTDFGVVP